MEENGDKEISEIGKEAESNVKSSESKGTATSSEKTVAAVA